MSNAFAAALLDKEIHHKESKDPSVKEHGLADVLIRTGAEAIDHSKMRTRALHIEDSITLLINQNQYLQGRITDQQNILVAEIRNTYCATMRMRKNEAILMANFDPILAAKSLGLDQCFSVVGYGSSLILQQCTPIDVEIEGIINNCGPQPIAQVNNITYSLSPNGVTLVPYFHCLHRSKSKSIGGATYSFIDGSWLLQESIVHVNNLKLVGNSKEI